MTMQAGLNISNPAMRLILMSTFKKYSSGRPKDSLIIKGSIKNPLSLPLRKGENQISETPLYEILTW